MLFGRKREEPPERVGVDMLAQLLARLFDSSMKGMASRAGRTAESISDGWNVFGDACNSFSRMEADPDLEDLPNVTAANVSALRANYVKALKEVSSGRRRKEGMPTLYESYKAELEGNELMINQVLQINHRFRPVIIAYAAYLDKFKRAFSSLEKGVRELRDCIGGYSGSFDTYKGALAMVRELALYLESIEDMRANLDRGASPDMDEDTSSVERSIMENRAAMEALDRSMASSRARLASLFTPMERAARKYDHVKDGKERLCDYLSDTSRILSSYDSFTALLDDLEKEVMEGTVEVRDTDELYRKIREVRSANVKAILESEAALAKEREALLGVSRSYARQLSEKRARIGSAEMRRREMDEIGRELKSSEKRKADLKSRIEQVFLDAYGKRIDIVY